MREKTMTDEDVEKIIKRNMNLQMNLAGIRADFEEAQQRTWVGLSVFEINDLVENTEYEDYLDLVERTEAKLKEKNT
jgi:hypothetical protein